MTTHNLLVVDDEATIRNFLVRVLDRAGYTVESANDGREALDKLRIAPVDLLLTDIRMDHLDGVELLAEAKALYPDLAVILLTGHATMPSALEALRQGAHDYLLKPVKNEDILAAVEAGLESRKREQRRDRLETLAGQMLGVMTNGATPNGDVMLGTNNSSARIHLAALDLDPAAYIATLDGERLDLTPTEFRLLLTLSQSPGAAFEYVELVEEACGYTCARHEAREIIGTHVLNLRKKLAIEADDPLYVESVRGVGYRLIPPT